MQQICESFAEETQSRNCLCPKQRTAVLQLGK